MSTKLQSQINLFTLLPENMRSMLLELAQVKTPVKVYPKPDVVASPVVIMLSICRKLEICPVDLRSKSQKRTPAYARFMAIHLLRQNGLTTVKIGQFFNRNHSTVLYGTTMHEEMMFSNAAYREKYAAVLESIKTADREAVTA